MEGTELSSPFPDLSEPISSVEYKPTPEPVFEKPGDFVIDEMPLVEEPFVSPIQPEQEFWKVREKSDETTFSAPINQLSEEKPNVAKPAAFDASFRIPDDQLAEIIRRVSENVIEKIAWEVVPDMAERIIKDEIKRLTEAEK